MKLASFTFKREATIMLLMLVLPLIIGLLFTFLGPLLFTR